MEPQAAGGIRLGRFAAVTVPAVVAAVGLALTMLQGMVGAVISSANGFTLQSDAITTSSLKLRPGQATATDGNDETVYAETGNTTNAKGVTVIAKVPIPVLGTAQLTIDSKDPSIGLGNVILNAKTLAVADGQGGANGGSQAAVLDDVTIGVAQSEAGFSSNPGSGYVPGGFALTANASTLNNLNATTYAISLASLAVDDLSIGVSLSGN